MRKQRVMIQAERSLLDRARRAARERGVSFPQLVREALERELASRYESPPALTSIAVVETGGEARRRDYQPDAWR